jgi:hypothetical protein
MKFTVDYFGLNRVIIYNTIKINTSSGTINELWKEFKKILKKKIDYTGSQDKFFLSKDEKTGKNNTDE